MDRVSASFGLSNLSPFMQEQQCIAFGLSLECLDKYTVGYTDRSEVCDFFRAMG